MEEKKTSVPRTVTKLAFTCTGGLAIGSVFGDIIRNLAGYNDKVIPKWYGICVSAGASLIGGYLTRKVVDYYEDVIDEVIDEFGNLVRSIKQRGCDIYEEASAESCKINTKCLEKFMVDDDSDLMDQEGNYYHVKSASDKDVDYILDKDQKMWRKEEHDKFVPYSGTEIELREELGYKTENTED